MVQTLPYEIWPNIGQYLSRKDWCAACQVSKCFQAIFTQDQMYVPYTFFSFLKNKNISWKELFELPKRITRILKEGLSQGTMVNTAYLPPFLLITWKTPDSKMQLASFDLLTTGAPKTVFDLPASLTLFTLEPNQSRLATQCQNQESVWIWSVQPSGDLSDKVKLTYKEVATGYLSDAKLTFVSGLPVFSYANEQSWSLWNDRGLCFLKTTRWFAQTTLYENYILHPVAVNTIYAFTANLKTDSVEMAIVGSIVKLPCTITSYIANIGVSANGDVVQIISTKDPDTPFHVKRRVKGPSIFPQIEIDRNALIENRFYVFSSKKLNVLFALDLESKQDSYDLYKVPRLEFMSSILTAESLFFSIDSILIVGCYAPARQCHGNQLRGIWLWNLATGSKFYLAIQKI